MPSDAPRTVDPPAPPDSQDAPLVFTRYKTPNGWLLRPAGTQIDTDRAPTGVTVSPDGRTVAAVSSSIFLETLTLVDASTLAHTVSPSSDLYMGAAFDGAGNLWASGGSRNRVWQYKVAGPAGLGTRHVGIVPGTPSNGVPVAGYPGSMALAGDRLFVAGNLSVPEGYRGVDCAQSTICSVVSVIDVSDPDAPSPAVRSVPVGRDAFGLALDAARGKLYVTNWADETNSARAGGTGTVSVLDIATPGSEAEVQVYPVGHHPTAIALAPDGSALFVANSSDDSLSKLSLGADGTITGAETLDVRTTADAPPGATPLSLGFSPDGAFLFVGLAGQNAVEVRRADGSAIPRTVTIGRGTGATSLNVPHTYVPVGWYPSALASAPHPVTGATRLYVANIKGIGAGPGLNGDAEPLNGSRTQGTLSVIDVPSSSDDERFDEWTATVVENNRWASVFDPNLRTAAKDPCKPARLPNGRTVLSGVICGASRGTLDRGSLHVVYVVKENKTFDQYFGDIRALVPDAEADPSWLLYGYPVTTNHHRLAKRFTLMDNFWSDADVSTTGHSWTSAGYANEYVEITWNPEYSQGLRGSRRAGQYDGSAIPGDDRIPGGAFPASKTDKRIETQEGELFEPAERLVDTFAEDTQHLSFRIYSDDVNNGSDAKSEQAPMALWGIGSSAVHHGRDLDFPDTDRVSIFTDGRVVSNAWAGDSGPPPPTFGKEIGFCGAPDDPNVQNAPYESGSGFCDRPGATSGEYQKFSLDAWSAAYAACRAGDESDEACQRAMPNFIYMALPVNHTLGYDPMSPTPASMVADNDYAFGRLVEALSKSPFWKNTLIVALEDDTQLAGDHIDAHRTYLLAAGGLARLHGPGGHASHQAGSFPSVLKTIEVLFGLPPLTIYDAGAVPLHDIVVPGLDRRNNEVYEAVRPPTPFLRNGDDGSDLALLSAMIDWRVDEVNQELLNAILYSGLKGWPLPARYRALISSRE
ncbi:MAG: bifunctional YncE family protein/alkaline phosphatase family protein [Acidobacteria bacterium]|nr:bifunctional YncE family protein/alkaline phosphatase family protein [Acidobacteriota bacterium]